MVQAKSGLLGSSPRAVSPLQVGNNTISGINNTTSCYTASLSSSCWNCTARPPRGSSATSPQPRASSSTRTPWRSSGPTRSGRSAIVLLPVSIILLPVTAGGKEEREQGGGGGAVPGPPAPHGAPHQPAVQGETILF